MHDLEALVTTANPDTPDAFTAAVAVEVGRLRVREAAARVVRLERAGALPEAPLIPLGAFLAVLDPPQRYRIEAVLPIGARVIFVAPAKLGKTTLRDNTVRSLADGERFLGQFAIQAFEGVVVVFDDELDERMLRRWLRDQHIVHVERVVVVSLRGRLSSFDLLDPDNRAGWAVKLRSVGAAVVVLDCLRAVLDAHGLSEDKDAGRFLVAFDELLREAGVGEALVVHHAGHGAERSRGDSRIRDWPDVEWTLVREKDEEGHEMADGRRFFAAHGRDVDVPEGLLEYDAVTRRLRLAGGSRKETAADALIPELLEYLTNHPGASGRQIEAALSPPNHRAKVRQALSRAIRTGQIATSPGPRRSTLHTVSPVSAPVRHSAPPVCQRSSEQCASAYVNTHAHSHTEEGGTLGATAAHSTDPEVEI